jgi:hypothetical protein
MSEQQIYDSKAAAKYLGIGLQTLKDHVYTYKDLSGQVVGGALVFTRAELDRFKAAPRRGRGRPAGAKDSVPRRKVAARRRPSEEQP